MQDEQITTIVMSVNSWLDDLALDQSLREQTEVDSDPVNWADLKVVEFIKNETLYPEYKDGRYTYYTIVIDEASPDASKLSQYIHSKLSQNFPELKNISVRTEW